MLDNASPAFISQSYFSDHLSGFGRTFDKPMPAGVQLALQTIALGGCLTCEEAFRYLMSEIAKAKGKKHAKPTTQQRRMLLRIRTLAHQFKSSTHEVALSTSRLGESKETTNDFLKLLCEAGCLTTESVYWCLDKTNRKNCRSKHYRISPLFLEALDFIAASLEAGPERLFVPVAKSSKSHKSAIDVISNSSKSTTILTNTQYSCILSSSSPEFPRHFLSGENSGLDVDKLCELSRQELYSLKRRRNSIMKLWGVPTVAESRLIAEKAKFKCHHVGLGAEASDIAVTQAIRDQYHFQEIEAAIAIADSALPPEYHTCLNVKITRDKNGNIHKIGCRPCNKLCGTENETKPSSTRLEELAKLGMQYHYDVHCSIFTTERALKTGIWVEAHTYTAIAEELHTARFMAKQTMMMANFGLYAEQAAKNPFGKRANSLIGSSQSLKAKRKCPDYVPWVTYGAFQRAMRIAGVEPMGTDTSIFFHEGAIYGIARRILLEEYGIKSICVYDSFNTNKPVDSIIDEVLQKALDEYRGICSIVYKYKMRKA